MLNRLLQSVPPNTVGDIKHPHNGGLNVSLHERIPPHGLNPTSDMRNDVRLQHDLAVCVGRLTDYSFPRGHEMRCRDEWVETCVEGWAVG